MKARVAWREKESEHKEHCKEYDVKSKRLQRTEGQHTFYALKT
jgi:hypothetical protein